jgi:integrase/recombinase XerD
MNTSSRSLFVPRVAFLLRRRKLKYRESLLQIRPSSERKNFLLGQRGEPLSAHAIYNVVVKYGRLAGLDEVTPHSLRHTFARTLLASGTPINDVADLLGHSSLDTTRIYTKASETDLATVVARLEHW